MTCPAQDEERGTEEGECVYMCVCLCSVLLNIQQLRMEIGFIRS